MPLGCKGEERPFCAVKVNTEVKWLQQNPKPDNLAKGHEEICKQIGMGYIWSQLGFICCYSRRKKERCISNFLNRFRWSLYHKRQCVSILISVPISTSLRGYGVCALCFTSKNVQLQEPFTDILKNYQFVHGLHTCPT